MDPNNIFNRPPKGTDLRGEDKERRTGDLHNSNLYDEEGESHGGEAVDPATGKPNKNKDGEPTIAEEMISSREATKGKDIMGDIEDPSKMSLEDLLKTQND